MPSKVEKEKKKTPQLRFPGFVGDWEEKRLGEYFDFKNGINAVKESYGSGVKFVNVLDIIENDFITYDRIIGEVNVSEKELEKNDVRYGDVLFQRSSETREEVGQANVYLDKEKVATFGGFVIRGRGKMKYDPRFFNYLFRTRKARREVVSFGAGSTRYNIGQDSLALVVVRLPRLEEQEKIAEFLSSVDEWIGNLRAQKGQWEEYKKGMMQKIFSQEIRFKADDGSEFPDWEEKRVGDLFKVTRGNVLAVKEMHQEPSGSFVYPVYSSQTKENGLIGFYSDFLYKDAITWTTDGANAGDVQYRPGKFYCTNVCGVLLSVDGFANSAIAELLNRHTYKYVSYVGNPKLMNNVMSEIRLRVPSLEEQEKIAEFLSSIDDLINSLEQRIAKAEEWKRGLMQKMFV